MNESLKKLLYYMDWNSRIPSKELGKLLRVSQQAASYRIKSIEDRSTIKGYATIIDPIKLGFMHVLVGYRLRKLKPSNVKDMQKELLEKADVVSVQVGSAGVDFLVEYSAQNLSSFNKSHTQFLSKKYKDLQTLFVHPIIVRHIYPRNYLVKKPAIEEMVILGDRELENLTRFEKAVVDELVKNPKATLSIIALKASQSIKTVAAIKKRLEKRLIIRAYRPILNFEDIKIERSVLLLELENIDDTSWLVEFSKVNPNIIQLDKILGKFSFAITIEGCNATKTIREIREQADVQAYRILNISSVEKEKYLPN